MGERDQAWTVVKRFLDASGGGEPLRVVELTARLQEQLDLEQRAAVRAAADSHTWAEIGAALGVSKQAAHRRFVTALADDLKAQHHEMKRARRGGRSADAAAARTSVQATAETLRRARKKP